MLAVRARDLHASGILITPYLTRGCTGLLLLCRLARVRTRMRCPLLPLFRTSRSGLRTLLRVAVRFLSPLVPRFPLFIVVRARALVGFLLRLLSDTYPDLRPPVSVSFADPILRRLSPWCRLFESFVTALDLVNHVVC